MGSQWRLSRRAKGELAQQTRNAQSSEHWVCKCSKRSLPLLSTPMLIALREEYASRDDWVLEGTGADFANGYTTSGGLPVEVWERFKETCLEIVMKEMLVERRRSREAEEIGQRNTLDTYLIKEPSSMGMQLAHKFVKFNQNHV